MKLYSSKYCSGLLEPRIYRYVISPTEWNAENWSSPGLLSTAVHPSLWIILILPGMILCVCYKVSVLAPLFPVQETSPWGSGSNPGFHIIFCFFSTHVGTIFEQAARYHTRFLETAKPPPPQATYEVQQRERGLLLRSWTWTPPPWPCLCIYSSRMVKLVVDFGAKKSREARRNGENFFSHRTADHSDQVHRRQHLPKASGGDYTRGYRTHQAGVCVCSWHGMIWVERLLFGRRVECGHTMIALNYHHRIFRL